VLPVAIMCDMLHTTFYFHVYLFCLHFVIIRAGYTLGCRGQKGCSSIYNIKIHQIIIYYKYPRMYVCMFSLSNYDI
jgi:hypothetical protein